MQLEPGWLDALGPEFEAPYMAELRAFLVQRRDAGAHIYPRASLWFHAFNSAPFADVRVVILGQDPYHGQGQAHGLCFSVPQGVAAPPSLLNIYKEIASDLGRPSNSPGGHLQAWADQGVLLLNSVLTVERGSPASHSGKGWEAFTDAAIRTLGEQREGLVFMLWGSKAGAKASLVDGGRHLVLRAAHPSPLSASSGFFGCRHFSQANAWLQERGAHPIDW